MRDGTGVKDCACVGDWTDKKERTGAGGTDGGQDSSINKVGQGLRVGNGDVWEGK